MIANCPHHEVADCHRPGSERGTSMLEIVLMISILSLMISGGVLMFEASSKQQARGAAGQISPISAAVAATPEVADAQVANVDAAAKAEVEGRTGVQDNTPAEADPERTKAVFSILAFFLA